MTEITQEPCVVSLSGKDSAPAVATAFSIPLKAIELQKIHLTQKHSFPIHISPKLFRNKRLKRKRIKWLNWLKDSKNIPKLKTEQQLQYQLQLQQQHHHHHQQQQQNNRRTFHLNPDVTIDLVSDEDSNEGKDKKSLIKNENHHHHHHHHQQYQQHQQHQKQQQAQNQNHHNHHNNNINNNNNNNNNDLKSSLYKLEPLYVCTGLPVELCKTPNITLVPVQLDNFQIHSFTNSPTITDPQLLQDMEYLNNLQHLSNLQHLNNLQLKNSKRKRKSMQPKRVPNEAIVLNNESIVLSDDDGDTHAAGDKNKQNKTKVKQEMKKDYSFNQHVVDPFQHSIPTCHQTHNVSINSLQVDEEVTVSLVPRNSAAGSCPNSIDNNNSPFPMLPDETTVQTVIANRTYELSLSKLREGLATSSITTDQITITPIPKGRTKCNSSPICPPPPPPRTNHHGQPISLKLSSDLSISLISDDDDGEEQAKQILRAERLLQQHPQLSVQHLQFPPAKVTVVRRREKLS